MNEIKLGEWQIRAQPQLDAGYYYHPDLCAYVVQPELFEQLRQKLVNVDQRVMPEIADVDIELLFRNIKGEYVYKDLLHRRIHNRAVREIIDKLQRLEAFEIAKMIQ